MPLPRFRLGFATRRLPSRAVKQAIQTTDPEGLRRLSGDSRLMLLRTISEIAKLAEKHEARERRSRK
jgi:hypothetical protein